MYVASARVLSLLLFHSHTASIIAANYKQERGNGGGAVSRRCSFFISPDEEEGGINKSFAARNVYPPPLFHFFPLLPRPSSSANESREGRGGD